MTRAAFAGALVALALAAAPAPAAASGCPALDYRADVAAAAAAITASPPNLASARAGVDAALAIGGSAALDPVRDDLESAPIAVDDAAQRLTSIASALAYPTGATCNEDPSAARATLHDVYASPEFRNLDSAGSTSFLQSIINAINNALQHLGGALGLGGAIAVLAVAAVIAAFFINQRLRRAARTHAAIAPDALPLGDDPAAEWRLSDAAARRGEYREATRRAFRATLLEVALRGGTRVDPAWTTRELLRQVEVAPHVVVALAAAASSFDHAWYSGEPVSRDEWETARVRCEAVRVALRTRVGAPAS